MKSINLLLFTAIFFISCDTTSDNGLTDKTYPEAYDFKKVTLSELRNDFTVADSVNMDFYVVDLFECPENARCFIADYLMISESLVGKDSIAIGADMPSQFNVNEQYLFSLKVTRDTLNNSFYFGVLGYSSRK